MCSVRMTVVFMILMACFTGVKPDEPACSKFDFQERLLEKMVNLENKLEAVEQQLTEKAVVVAFSTTIGKYLEKLSPGSTVVYDRVETNIGNGYNRHTGHFTCPRTGIYILTLSILARSGEHLQLDLIHNGARAISVISDGAGWSQGSNTKVLQLNQGDALWVRSRAHSQGQTLWADNYVAFAGFLLSAN